MLLNVGRRGRIKCQAHCFGRGWWIWSWVPKPMKSVCQVSWFLGMLPFSSSELITARKGKDFKKEGVSWSLPAYGIFFTVFHLVVTISSSFLVGRLSFARIQKEWRQGSPLVPRFAMTGATAIHGALALSAGGFALWRRRTSLALLCNAKRVLRRARTILGDKVESEVGLLGRYSYLLFIILCLAKAETALHMLVSADVKSVADRRNDSAPGNSTKESTTVASTTVLTTFSDDPSDSENSTAEPVKELAFLADTDVFFSKFFQSGMLLPSWLQQAPFMWIQLAAIASEGQMTGLCAMLRSSLAAMNVRLEELLGIWRQGPGKKWDAVCDGPKRGRGFDLRRNFWNQFKSVTCCRPKGCGAISLGRKIERAPGLSLHVGWRQWFDGSEKRPISSRGIPPEHVPRIRRNSRWAVEWVTGLNRIASPAAKPLYGEIVDLRRLFSSLMDLHDGINKRFGDELLVNTIGGRCASVLTLYAGLFMIFDHRYRPSERQPSSAENRTSYLTLYLLILLFQLLVYLSRLVYVCYSCHRVCSAVARTKILLQEFRARRMDGNASRELAIFSAQLECRCIEFSAGGFFAVDLKFLHSIFGSLFTYLIILIQFQTP